MTNEAHATRQRLTADPAMPVPFHLAIPVHDLDEARRFYLGTLGCGQGRSGADWLDLDFFGHQIVVHVMPAGAPQCLVKVGENRIDGHAVPLPHFGVVLEMDPWKTLVTRLTRDGVTFVREPHIRYEGRVNEQASMMLHDPSGNAIEFKAFANVACLFAT